METRKRKREEEEELVRSTRKDLERQDEEWANLTLRASEERWPNEEILAVVFRRFSVLKRTFHKPQSVCIIECTNTGRKGVGVSFPQSFENLDKRISRLERQKEAEVTLRDLKGQLELRSTVWYLPKLKQDKFTGQITRASLEEALQPPCQSCRQMLEANGITPNPGDENTANHPPPKCAEYQAIWNLTVQLWL